VDVRAGLLRDEPAERYVDRVGDVSRAPFGGRAHIHHERARFLPRGFLVPAAFDLFEMLAVERPRPADRTYLGGTEKPPPETVPLADADFASEAERDAVLEPWAVTDADGRMLPQWLGAQTVYLPKGRVAPQRAFVPMDVSRLAPRAAVPALQG